MSGQGQASACAASILLVRFSFSACFRMRLGCLKRPWPLIEAGGLEWVTTAMTRVRDRPTAIVDRQLAHAMPVLAVVMFAALSLPSAARAADAECGVTDSGIPDGVFTPIDVAHIRKSLADAGIGLGGSYVGEAFTNTGGIKQGGTYDGLLTLYLKADLKKMGLWKGLCLSTSAFQIHGNSITAENIGSLMPVSNLEATPATRSFEI
jgi:carbohydrate-selective porin OprB